MTALAMSISARLLLREWVRSSSKAGRVIDVVTLHQDAFGAVYGF
jgi:hypothetical protein